jgi:UDP-glucose 4-epimerase
MITGGMGFVGSHLCESLLKENHDLVILTKSFKKKHNVKKIKTKVKQEKIDVTNFSKLGKSIEKNKPDVLIHLAGQTSHSKSFENPVYDIDVNARSTLFMLQKIKTLNLKCKFVLGSTFIVIGKPQKLPVNEQSICNPTTIYGANRLVSEHYCKIFNQVYGLDTLVFRITNSFGPREQVIFPLWQNCLQNNINSPICPPMSMIVSSSFISKPDTSYSLVSQMVANCIKSVDFTRIFIFKLELV